MKLIKLTALVLAILVLISFTTGSKVFGQISTYVNASIQIGVCGNGVVEKGEDCDGTNLNNKSCTNLGYGGGTLSCDISCSYNTFACITLTSTPTPTPTPTHTPTPTSTPTLTPPISTPTLTPIPTPIPTTTTAAVQTPIQKPPVVDDSNIPIPSPTELQTTPFGQTTTPSPTHKGVLPPALKVFDFNGDGKIDSDVHGVVSLWINSWKKYLAQDVQHANQAQTSVCDLNHNNSCNLDDFSILMYYVGR